MDRKIKIGAVSYLNTKPLTYGFKEFLDPEEMELTFDYPSKVATKLMDGTIDIGLVPVATIPLIPNAHIISDYCIGTENKVNSVCIFSREPIENIKRLYLDYQSRTSIQLAEVLLKEYWKLDVELIKAEEGYIDEIIGDTAGVIIGDRALQNLHNFEYVYDLGEMWRNMTGLPFVFAAWVANKPIDEAFINKFNQANSLGFKKLDQVIQENQIDYYDLYQYYTQDISYSLDHEKVKGLRLFLQKINPNFEFKVQNEK